ncbi:ficolin-1-like [Penaeus japonicus]|uniref:ficolin-1-like n=1 Tax=Penaeus japonicus TaxID=27405 RepID=UPI001C71493E|nr:ficolin-1-like [Penaeus japonicus]XP_042867274.1 ficolin-1-like [Penaeus japonicus]
MRTWACVLAVGALLAAGSQQRGAKAEISHEPSESKRSSITEEAQRMNAESPTGFQLKPADCADHLLMGSTTSGVYEIYPFSCSCREPVRVWCDMETDGGGWTVFMARQRQTPQVDFNRSWTEYKEGFGDPTGEFWLGNEMMHRITSGRKYSLRVDLTLTNQIQQFAEWEEIRLGSEADKYRMKLGEYLPQSSTYTNCLNYLNKRYFTTYDRDYDHYTGNCAAKIGGGWWTYHCRFMQLTGVYNQGLNTTCSSLQVQVARAQMKVRPTICNESLKRISLNSYQCETCS